MKYQARTQGFTLIELMIVIVVIAILAVIAYPSFQQFIERSRLENARSLMNDNIRMMEQHYGKHRTFCVGATNANSGNNNGACANTPALKGDPDSGYAIELEQPKSSSYLMIATPLNASHNSDEKKLYLVYSSVSGTFSRCTKAGKDDSLSSNSGTLMMTDDECEIF